MTEEYADATITQLIAAPRKALVEGIWVKHFQRIVDGQLRYASQVLIGRYVAVHRMISTARSSTETEVEATAASAVGPNQEREPSVNASEIREHEPDATVGTTPEGGRIDWWKPREWGVLTRAAITKS